MSFHYFFLCPHFITNIDIILSYIQILGNLSFKPTDQLRDHAFIFNTFAFIPTRGRHVMQDYSSNLKTKTVWIVSRFHGFVELTVS
jgi:hypothetical protein